MRQLNEALEERKLAFEQLENEKKQVEDARSKLEGQLNTRAPGVIQISLKFEFLVLSWPKKNPRKIFSKMKNVVKARKRL